MTSLKFLNWPFEKVSLECRTGTLNKTLTSKPRPWNSEPPPLHCIGEGQLSIWAQSLSSTTMFILERPEGSSWNWTHTKALFLCIHVKLKIIIFSVLLMHQSGAIANQRQRKEGIPMLFIASFFDKLMDHKLPSSSWYHFFYFCWLMDSQLPREGYSLWFCKMIACQCQWLGKGCNQYKQTLKNQNTTGCFISFIISPDKFIFCILNINNWLMLMRTQQHTPNKE